MVISLLAAGLLVGAVVFADGSVAACAVPGRQDTSTNLTNIANAQMSDAGDTADVRISNTADTADAQTPAVEDTATAQTDAAQQTSRADQQRNPHQSNLHQA